MVRCGQTVWREASRAAVEQVGALICRSTHSEAMAFWRPMVEQVVVVAAVVVFSSTLRVRRKKPRRKLSLKRRAGLVQWMECPAPHFIILIALYLNQAGNEISWS